MGILDLPAELIISITQHLTTDADISAFSRTSRLIHSLVISELYKHNAKNSHSSALRFGAMTGGISIMKLAIENGANLETAVDRSDKIPASVRERRHAEIFQDKKRMRDTRNCVAPLGCAAVFGREEGCRLLLDHGAEMEAVDIWLRTPLHLAARTGDLALVRLLIERGADTSARNSDEMTALWPAIRSDNTELVRWMVLDQEAGGAGFDVNARSGHLTVLAQEMSLSMFETLLDCGARMDATDRRGRDVVMWAVDDGMLDFLEALLARGASASCRDVRGRSALMEAAASGAERAPEILKLLLKHGADVNESDAEGHTALLEASKLGDGADRILALVEAGADVNAADLDGTTALAHAAYFGDVEGVRVLLEKGKANVESREFEGRTPLHRVVMHLWRPGMKDKRVQIVKLLLEHGAQIDARDRHNCTPLMLVADSSEKSGECEYHLEVAKILMEAGADLHAADGNGSRILGHRKDEVPLVALLEEVWENMNKKKQAGRRRD